MAPSTETSTSETSQPGQPSPTTFPRFGDLPVEIRHMIWQLALENSLEPRIIPLHIHIRTIKQQGNDGEGNPQDSNTSSQIKVRYIAESTQTSACKYCYQASHHPGVILPSLLTVCRESRAITRRNYGIYFSKLCDATTGRPLDPQPQQRPEEPLRVPPPPPLPWQVNNGALFPWIQASLNNIMSHNEGLTKTIRKGVYANPAIDHFGLQVQIATQGRLEVIDGFIAVAEHEEAFATRIQTFLIELSTGGRPYLWYRQNQFDRWRRIGEDPSWVPAKKLIKFERLKEVVVFVRGRIMLTVFPEEWRVRSAQQWREELMKVREEWPAKWKGEMPKLTFKLRDEHMLRPEYETLIYV